METRTKKLFIIQMALVVGVFLFILFMILSEYTRDLDQGTVTAGMASAENSEALLDGNARDVRKVFGLDVSDYDWIIYKHGDGLMDVSEYLIVKTDDSDAMEAAEEAVATRLSSQKQNFDGYGTNQTELLNNAVLEQKGDYYFYAVSENSSQWEEVFLKLIK